MKLYTIEVYTIIDGKEYVVERYVHAPYYVFEEISDKLDMFNLSESDLYRVRLIEEV